MEAKDTMISRTAFILIVAVVLGAPLASALPVEITFQGVPTADGGGFNSSNAEIATLESQLLAVYDVVDADTVSFTFTNNVGLASSIGAIYFDDNPEGSQAFPGLESGTAALGESAGVDFGLDAPAPPKPGAGIFGNYIAFGVDSESSPLGINAAGEYLTIAFDLSDGYNASQITSAVMDGSLNIALHVQSIGAQSTSDWFVSNGHLVPEPASLTLLGLGIAGLAAYRRTRASRSR